MDNTLHISSQLFAGGVSASPLATRKDTGSRHLVSTHRHVHLFPRLILLASSLCDNLRLRASPRLTSFHMPSYLFIYLLPWQGGKLCKGTPNHVCQLPWSPGRGAGQRGRSSLTADRLDDRGRGQRALFRCAGLQSASHTPWLRLSRSLAASHRLKGAHVS